jgi:hypothetical protein
MGRMSWKSEQTPAAVMSPANMACVLGGDVECAMAIWRVMNVKLAQRCVRLVPESRACHDLLLAARRGELPLWNPLPEQRECQP